MKHFSSNKSYSDYLRDKNKNTGSISTIYSSNKKNKKRSQFHMLNMVAEVGINQESEAFQNE